MTDSALEFISMASQAARAYLQEGVALDDAIAKIASAKDLSRVQIQRVVELANHETNEQLMKQAADKTFRFGVASVDGVLSKLGVGQPMAKVAAYDVRLAMGSYRDKDAELESIKKFASATLDCESARTARVTRAVAAMNKVAARLRIERSHVLAKLATVHEDIRDAMADLTQVTKNSMSNGRSITDLHKFACCYDRENGPTWDVVFKSVKDGLIKAAASKNGPIDMTVAPLARRTPDPNHRTVTYEVVNGGQNLCINLDTLKNKISEDDRLSSRLRLMDTLGPAVMTSIKTLKTSADVAKHIAEEVEKTASRELDVDDFLVKTAGLVTTAVKLPFKAAWQAGKQTVKHPGLVGGTALAASAYLGLKAAAEEITKQTRHYQPAVGLGVAGGRPLN